MKIGQDKVVALSYQLEVEGKIVDKAVEQKPLEYIQGTGMLLPKFESEVDGKEPGDTFEFTLTAEEGYGEYNPDYKIEIPKSSFEVEGVVREDLLVVGKTIPMLNQDGGVVQGTVDSVKEDTVVMDFNHPMAGKTLHFTGSVVSVREATKKELEEGLHGEYLPREEGCHGNCHCHGDHNDGQCCCHGEDHNEGECGCHGEGHGKCHCN